ncbi:MAG: UPF0149 family protein [Pseudomonadota bacterium]
MDNHESKLAWILALAADHDPARVAETHGIVIGLLCGNPSHSESTLTESLAALQVGDWDSDRIREQLGPALAGLHSELSSPELEFRPLLPTSDRSLDERTRCLASWCSGFMTGFGASFPASAMDKQPPETNEALQMLEQISRAASDPDTDAEAEESAFFELAEFVKVAALLLREQGLREAA